MNNINGTGVFVPQVGQLSGAQESKLRDLLNENKILAKEIDEFLTDVKPENGQAPQYTSTIQELFEYANDIKTYLVNIRREITKL